MSTSAVTPGALSLIAVDAVREAQGYFDNVSEQFKQAAQFAQGGSPDVAGAIASAQTYAETVRQQLNIALLATAQLNNDIG